MLLIISLLVATIAFLIIFYCDIRYWHTEALEILSTVLGCIAGIAFFVTAAVLISIMCGAPAEQAIYEEEYSKLMQKVKYIDSFNREEVITQVDEWNKNYRTNIYAKKSPWIGWFYTIDTSTTSLIDLNGGANEQ